MVTYSMVQKRDTNAIRDLLSLDGNPDKRYKCSKVVNLVIKVCFDFVIKNMKYYKWFSFN
jgi:hypothetical protein